MEPKLHNLLEVLYTKYGYDFHEYADAHVQRRVNNRLSLSSISLKNLIDKTQNDSAFAALLLQDLSVTVTEMFRDISFYQTLRKKVIPILKTYPFIKIWHAGCATGEEAYSMAIVLAEEGLYDRTTIYATDFNQDALNKAQEGIYPDKAIKDYTINYQKSGGRKSFSDYYTSNYNMAIIDKALKKNIVWANHNLVTDSVFSEVHLVLCRNVLIYFKRALQNKVHKLFFDSLIQGGILCLGSKESLRFTDQFDKYVNLDSKQRIFKKIYSQP